MQYPEYSYKLSKIGNRLDNMLRPNFINNAQEMIGQTIERVAINESADFEMVIRFVGGRFVVIEPSQYDSDSMPEVRIASNFNCHPATSHFYLLKKVGLILAEIADEVKAIEDAYQIAQNQQREERERRTLAELLAKYGEPQS